MMHLTERFQAHCRKCFRVIEEDTAVEAISKAEAHERECKVGESGKLPACPCEAKR